MGVNETRQNRFSTKIDLADTRAGKILNVRIASNGEKSAAGNGQGLGARLAGIHRKDVGVVEDEIRPLLFEREKRESGKGAEEFAAGRFV
ncbi:MAG: hypothetical protein HY255_06600 [Betaproteobacteria bacterium]|nr:hypothetical protein [Betaproteobacteria bacterium]